MEKIPSEHISAIEQDKQRAWSGLEKVGPDKPVGYLPLDTIESYLGKNVDEVAEYLRSKGLEVRIFTGPEWPGFNGSLYAYNKIALQKLLDENKQILIAADWPIVADEFVANLKVNARIGTPIYKVIAKSFADKFTEGLEEE
jgi:hypothetical protein